MRLEIEEHSKEAHDPETELHCNMSQHFDAGAV